MLLRWHNIQNEIDVVWYEAEVKSQIRDISSQMNIFVDDYFIDLNVIDETIT